MPSFIPVGKQQRVDWAKNFKSNFPAVAPDYGFGEEQVKNAVAACETIIYVITLAREAKKFSKICTIYRDGILAKEIKPNSLPPLNLPDAPPVLFDKNPIGYLQEIAGYMKVQPKYTSSVGSLLRIAAPSAASFASVRDAKPKIRKLRALANSVVRIDWIKSAAQGVIIESQRGDETAWTMIDRDMHSPFIDTRPPLVAGKPEERRYRLRYFINDEPVGVWSEIYTAVTMP